MAFRKGADGCDDVEVFVGMAANLPSRIPCNQPTLFVRQLNVIGMTHHRHKKVPSSELFRCLQGEELRTLGTRLGRTTSLRKAVVCLE